MSDNIDIVRGGYNDFLAGNVPGVLERFADDFTFSVPGAPDVPYAGTFHNRAELGRFFQEMGEEITMSLFEPREYFASGDRVVVLGHYEGKVNRTGAPYASDWAMAWTFKDGKVVAMQELSDPAQLRKGFAG